MFAMRVGVFVAALVVLSCPSSAADEKAHPFLVFNNAQLNSMRQRAADSSTITGDRLERILKRINLDYTISYPSTDSSIREDWIAMVRKNSDVMRMASIAWLLTGEQKYLDFAKATFLDWAENFDSKVNFHRWRDRCYMRIYETGSLGINAAVVYDMLYNDLTPAEREIIETKLLRGIVDMVRNIDKMPPSEGNAYPVADYEWGPGQWNGVKAANAAIAAIGFVLDDEQIYEHAVENYRVYVARDILGDGLYYEEDWSYASFCINAMALVAEFAHNSGYGEDLYNTRYAAKPADQWDSNYGQAFEAIGAVKPTRSLRDYYDAVLNCQYPNLARTNLGWQKNSAALIDSRAYTSMYELAHWRFNGNPYGWLLDKMPRSRSTGTFLRELVSMVYADLSLVNKTRPDSYSKVYNHGSWLVLKSVRGSDYWDSDSMYAFLPFGIDRSKGLRKLSLDLFGMGRVLAPRVNKYSRDQAHDHPWYLYDESWNNLMVDGANLDLLRNVVSDGRMRFADLDGDIQATQAVIEVQHKIIPSIWDDKVAERREDMDYQMGRALFMSSDYLVDAMHVKYHQQPQYLHGFLWNFHGAGKLHLEMAKHDSRPKHNCRAIWQQDDGVGLCTTVLPAPLPDSHRILAKATQNSEYIQLHRFAREVGFWVVHEPVRGERRLGAIEKLWTGELTQALHIERPGSYNDIICLSCDADEISGRSEHFDADIAGPYATIRISGRKMNIRGKLKYLRLSKWTDDVTEVFVNGQRVDFDRDGQQIVVGRAAVGK